MNDILIKLLENFAEKRGDEIRSQSEKLKMYETREAELDRRLENLPTSSEYPQEFADAFLTAYIESIIAFRHKLFRSALFNIVCIIEQILFTRFGFDTLHKNIEAGKDNAFINKKQYAFLSGIKVVRNEGIHDISDVSEEEVLIAFKLMDEIIRKHYNL